MDVYDQELHAERVKGIIDEMSRNCFSTTDRGGGMPRHSGLPPTGTVLAADIVVELQSIGREPLYDFNRSTDSLVKGASTVTMPSGTFQEPSGEP